MISRPTPSSPLVELLAPLSLLSLEEEPLLPLPVEESDSSSSSDVSSDPDPESPVSELSELDPSSEVEAESYGSESDASSELYSGLLPLPLPDSLPLSLSLSLSLELPLPLSLLL